jgi:three-Cys-motif partner protein
MASSEFHDKPFDEGTLTKLEIFQLYTREWLPVFLAREDGFVREVHLFDFFAGPGSDPAGVPGSPLRTLAVLKEYSPQPHLRGWGKVPIVAHFSDATRSKEIKLRALLERPEWQVDGVTTRTRCAEFMEAFADADSLLRSRDIAKLVLLDQCGVSEVTPEVFRKLVSYARTDFLFFISSATLHRFREHPLIKQKIRPAADFNQVHHAVLDYYREMLPADRRYYLAPFSIKKGSNIYGIIFGSAHPLGMDKFLTVAWDKDRLNGTANFDINRDSLDPNELMLDLGAAIQPRKLNAFEEELELLLRRRQLPHEMAVVDVCYRHGVMRKHASPVLQRLKTQGVIDIHFRTPSIENFKEPRPIRYT